MRNLRCPGFLLPLAVLALAGCDVNYIYRPTEHATARLADSGLPAALYSVPEDRPQGEVKVAALGVREIDGRDEPSLGMRLVVTNNSDEPWSLYAPDQSLVVDGRPRGPEYVSGLDRGQPGAVIPPRQQRSFDLWFVLPSEEVASFQLAWGIRTPSRLVTQRTSFRREELTAPPVAVYGGGYWYGSGFYPYGPGLSPFGYPFIGPSFGAGYGYTGGGAGIIRVAPALSPRFASPPPPASHRR